jgi:hypothetical protein
VHFFYHLMCPDCATFNYKKRIQTADLKGRIALMTGTPPRTGSLACVLVDGDRSEYCDSPAESSFPLTARAHPTGARIKIGYKAALVLLRCGAIVIATTRFPKDAAQRFAQVRP